MATFNNQQIGSIFLFLLLNTISAHVYAQVIFLDWDVSAVFVEKINNQIRCEYVIFRNDSFFGNASKLIVTRDHFWANRVVVGIDSILLIAERCSGTNESWFCEEVRLWDENVSLSSQYATLEVNAFIIF